jgi:hypothetical protein
MAAVAALEAIGRFISFMTVSTKALAASEMSQSDRASFQTAAFSLLGTRTRVTLFCSPIVGRKEPS